MRQEKCNINIPLDLAVNKEIDRFILAMGAINRVVRLRAVDAQVEQGRPVRAR